MWKTRGVSLHFGGSLNEFIKSHVKWNQIKSNQFLAMLMHNMMRSINKFIHSNGGYASAYWSPVPIKVLLNLTMAMFYIITTYHKKKKHKYRTLDMDTHLILLIDWIKLPILHERIKGKNPCNEIENYIMEEMYLTRNYHSIWWMMNYLRGWSRSGGRYGRNSLLTVINPDYNMKKQLCMKRIYDKIRSKSSPSRALLSSIVTPRISP